MTTRNQFEVVMQQGDSCTFCHKQFMPYGYMFSNFGALGQFQTLQKDRPVNAQVDSALLDGKYKPYDNYVSFADDLASSPSLHLCFSRKFTEFLLGRGSSDDVNYLTQLFTHKLFSNDLKVVTFIENALSSPELYKRSLQ